MVKIANKIVASFVKNSLEKVRAGIGEYKGKKIIDIRVWVEGKDGEIPTKKGLTLSWDLIGDLKEAILALERVIDDEKERLNK